MSLIVDVFPDFAINLLSNWLTMDEIGKLDSVFCQKQLRIEFLHLLSNKYLVIHEKTYYNRYIKYVVWLGLRKLKTSFLKLEREFIWMEKIIINSWFIDVDLTEILTIFTYDPDFKFDKVDLMQLLQSCPKLSTFPAINQLLTVPILSVFQTTFWNRINTLILIKPKKQTTKVSKAAKAHLISACTNLHSLRIQHCDFTFKNISCLLKNNLQQLKRFNFKHTSDTFNYIELIDVLIETQSTSLTELDLLEWSNVRFMYVPMDVVFKIFASFPKLVRLMIDCAVEYVTTIKDNQTNKCISINIEAMPGSITKQFFLTLHGLNLIQLEYACIYSSTLEDIQRFSPHLSTLYLRNCVIKSANKGSANIDFNNFLQNCKQLKTLLMFGVHVFDSVDGVAVTVADVYVELDAQKSLCTITHLTISNDGDEGYSEALVYNEAKIHEIIQHNPQLQYFSWYGASSTQVDRANELCILNGLNCEMIGSDDPMDWRESDEEEDYAEEY